MNRREDQVMVSGRCEVQPARRTQVGHRSPGLSFALAALARYAAPIITTSSRTLTSSNGTR